jgi:histidine ammonia-lyase
VTAVPPVLLDGAGLTAGEVVAVARRGRPVELSAQAQHRMAASRRVVDALAEGTDPVYGVSTGFGALATTRIERARWEELQHSLVRSHAAGMGEPVPAEVVRATMLLRARTLALGHSGTRPELAAALVDLLNAGICPVVPEFGSLGASGDLAPLAHIALVLLGEGEVLAAGGERAPAAAALAAAGLTPVRLAAKEGLSLINGTDGMLGMLLLACEDLELLWRTADVAAAMSVEALLGTDAPFADDVQRLRPHPGQRASAANLHRLLAGSSIVASHREGDTRVQDAYSMRCAPQVCGAARDVLAFAAATAAIELDSAIDNPSVLDDGRLVSHGNFHGEPLAFACDFLAIAAAEVGSIAERRVDRMLDATRSIGLPAFLAAEPGVDSGLMIAQYTAAALVTENRRLAVPASVDSIPTSGMQEDHVSLGWSAALKLRRSIDNLRRILAVEVLCAARALELRAPLASAPGTAAVVAVVRSRVPGVGPDRSPAPELAAVVTLIADGEVVSAAESAVGPLA